MVVSLVTREQFADSMKAAGHREAIDRLRGLLQWKGDHVVPSPNNLKVILSEHPDWKGLFLWDEFCCEVILGRAPPYEDPGQKRRAMVDEDLFHVAAQLGQQGFPVFSKDMIRDAIPAVAKEFGTFHPVVDYLKTVKWDGVSRLDNWLTTYFGVEQSEYSRLVGRYWLLSAVARVVSPGAQVDHMLILEGNQGIGKSTALGCMFGEEYTLSTLLDVANKESYMLMHGAWVVEFAELDGMRRADHNRLKAFLTEKKNSFVRKYSNLKSNVPRQCVFAGTVNDNTYLQDDTGGRRYWPVVCSKADSVAIGRDRDQLWAEAYATYAGPCVQCVGKQRCPMHRWWPSEAEQNTYFTNEQSLRRDTESWDVVIGDWLDKSISMTRFTVSDVLTKCFSLEPKDHDRVKQLMVARSMSKISGWSKKKLRVGDRTYNGYVKDIT